MKTKCFLVSSPGFALISLVLMSMFISMGCGCNTSKPNPDLLVGFRVSDLQNLDSNKVISADYKDYLRTLSLEEQKDAGPILFYEDGTGQHAVRIEIGVNGKEWEHVLIYNKADKRIKTIKYIAGRYMS